MLKTVQLIKELYKIAKELNELHPLKKFTPDGILVGSIGEVLAEYLYGISPLRRGYRAHDGMIGGLMVQVKTTQRESIQIGEPCEHLITQKLEPDGTVKEIYNGPGAIVWDIVKDKPLPKNGLYPVRLNKLRELMQKVPQKMRLKRIYL